MDDPIRVFEIIVYTSCTVCWFPRRKERARNGGHIVDNKECTSENVWVSYTPALRPPGIMEKRDKLSLCGSNKEKVPKKRTMKSSVKGALLSGLVFPGLGQVNLKHYKSGIALMSITSVSILVIIVKAVQQAFIILHTIELEGGVITMSAIVNAATQASSTSSGLVFEIAFVAIILCWIIGFVDAYRIGKKKDVEGGSTNQ